MRSLKKNAAFYAIMGLLLCSSAVFSLFEITAGHIQDRFRLFMSIIRTIIFLIYGAICLQNWQKLRKENSKTPNEKDL
jgi:uncharacterized membrane protein YqjE